MSLLVANGIMMPIIASRQRPDWLCRHQAALHPMRSQPKFWLLSRCVAPIILGNWPGFDFAVTRDQALHVLDQFIAERLPLFGTYQDAMIEGEPWMYHSHIGPLSECLDYYRRSK
jgi:hypothetical protein